MIKNEQNKRFIIDQFRAKNLEGNPLNSPVNRDLRIYLPPDYYDSESKRYPVLYYLHGYGGNNHNWTITSKDESESVLPLNRIPKISKHSAVITRSAHNMSKKKVEIILVHAPMK